jgi:hypothetical protein
VQSSQTAVVFAGLNDLRGGRSSGGSPQAKSECGSRRRKRRSPVEAQYR